MTMIELTYSDNDVSSEDFDRAILRALDTRRGYVVQLTTERGAEDVVIDRGFDDTLSYRHFDVDSGGPTGPLITIDRADIHGIKIY